MPRPITAVIHRQALQNNLAVVRKAMPNSKVFAYLPDQHNELHL